jgi:hypothetical protein
VIYLAGTPLRLSPIRGNGAGVKRISGKRPHSILWSVIIHPLLYFRYLPFGIFLPQGIPQDSLEGSSKADLNGVSRAELWNILSHVDVGEMVQRDDSESPHPPRPQFTNPFSAIADPPFTGSYLPVAPLYSSTNNEQIPLGSPFDPRSGLASLEDRAFTTPRHFLAHHESLIGQLFPRMSLDGEDSSNSDKINAGTMEADEDVAFGRYAGLQDTPDFPLDSQQSGFGLSTR